MKKFSMPFCVLTILFFLRGKKIQVVFPLHSLKPRGSQLGSQGTFNISRVTVVLTGRGLQSRVAVTGPSL